MSQLTGVKQYGTNIYPVHAAATSGLLRRAEPILKVDQLKSRFLKGIPLVFPNGDKFSNDELKDRIVLATSEAEALIDRPIFPEIFKEKAPFDWSLYKAFIHIKTEQGPITSLEYLSIVASDGSVIFTVPAQWIEASNFSKNLINVVPLLAAFGATSVNGSPITVTNQGAGIAFLAIWGASGNVSNVPAYWEIGYTAGLSNTEGVVPTIVNELIGCIAAIALLSEIAPLFVYTSQTLSQDGISQASSEMGPRRYLLRIEELTKKRDELIKKIRGIFASKYFIGNI